MTEWIRHWGPFESLPSNRQVRYALTKNTYLYYIITLSPSAVAKLLRTAMLDAGKLDRNCGTWLLKYLTTNIMLYKYQKPTAVSWFPEICLCGACVDEFSESCNTR
jgi:hypothetical protein